MNMKEKVTTKAQSMSLMTIKSDQQTKALNAWAKQNYIGSIVAGTGFGKSRCGVLAAAVILNRDGGRGLVIVPTTQLQAQFEEEFKKWGHEDALDSIDIICYQSAHKLRGEHYSVVICDEIHLGLSPVHRQFFEYNTYDKLLCMTATMPEEDEYREILINLAPICYMISLDSCVDLGLVAPYQIFCIPVDLTEEERANYKKANNLFVQMKYRLGQFDAFKTAQAILAKRIPGDAGAAAQFYRAIRERKKIVQHAYNKLEYAEGIVNDWHPKSKILVFSGTNDFTDSMAAILGGESYHSGKGKKQRTETLRRYKNGLNRVLCSTKALNQGFDVPDSEVGIIAGLDSKSLPMIQRVGRLLRLSGDKIGKVYILYVKDSQEEKWLNKAVSKLSNVNWITYETD
jgi:superfamily II DNA or RNA helicase